MDPQQHLDFLKMADIMLVELALRSTLVLLSFVAFGRVLDRSFSAVGKFLMLFSTIFLTCCFVNVAWGYRSLAASVGGHGILSYGVDWLNHDFFTFYISWCFALFFFVLGSASTKK